MAEDVSRERVRELVDENAQLVEALPPDEFEEDHLPGALNLPLRLLEEKAKDVLDRDRPIVVYCWDSA